MGYIPDYAYLVRLPGSDRTALSGLPGVRWVGDFLPAYRVDPGLWDARGPLTLLVQLFPGKNPAPLTQIPGIQVLETTRSSWQTTLRLTADEALLRDLAALPGVRWIEPDRPPRLTNDVATGLTGAAAVQSTLGLTGTGQIIAVADTGLDVGASGAITDFAGRIVNAYGIGRPGTWDDPHGHGTHVAGSALGSGALSGGLLQGIAPGAGLVVQSLYSPTQPGGLVVPTDLNLLLAPPYTDGARIHNDSWGVPGNRYDTRAQTADQFVWDHPDMLVVVASGNGGIDRGSDGLVDPGSLYSPATAKNVLAVGASESLRPGQGYTGTYGASPSGANFPADPVHSDRIADAPGGLAAFSSRGPASDGRVRPDLVAPGTNILSARSHHASAAYAFPYDDDYAFESGSSQAAPIASGAAALVRQWYVGQGVGSPTAALVRATLINGATDLSPGQYGPGLAGTTIVSDDVESTPVWTRTSGTWVVTDTMGYRSPDHAWLARGTELGFQRLDATVNVSGTAEPVLTFWNRRVFNGSTARVYVCGTKLLELSQSQGGNVGWAREALPIPISQCADAEAATVRFELQCTVGCNDTSSDLWALDDIIVANGLHLAEADSAPDPGQGWGRLNLTRSLPIQSTIWFTDELTGLQTGEAVTFTFPALPSGTPFHATLVWSDYPALPGAAVALVNDLDLMLVTADGTDRSSTGGDRPDRTNNVERVVWTIDTAGPLQVTVRGVNVPYGPQPFALVVAPIHHSHYLPFISRH
jgi:subtilisin family serine protease